MRVMGVDGCRAGWVGIAISEEAGIDGALRAYVAGEIGELVERAWRDGGLEALAIDMPIGLADAGRRRGDVLAREAVGARWQSVFMTPVRAAVEAWNGAGDDYRLANEINVQRAGWGISRQAFALCGKIRQLDRWVRDAPCRVVEAHPEVCFAEIAGGPLDVRKSTWAGFTRRRELLAESGIVLPADLGGAGKEAGVADVLDAAATAWTARRVARGIARSLPGEPERFSDGLECAVWV